MTAAPREYNPFWIGITTGGETIPNKKQSDNAGIEAIIKKNPVYAGKYIMKDMQPVKMSAVILDFAKLLRMRL